MACMIESTNNSAIKTKSNLAKPATGPVTLLNAISPETDVIIMKENIHLIINSICFF